MTHLQWCASEQQPALNAEAIQVPRQPGLPVLHAVSLVNHHVSAEGAHMWPSMMRVSERASKDSHWLGYPQELANALLSARNQASAEFYVMK